MFSEKDFERLWFLYKTEGEPNGVSINSFCIGNNIPYTAFYDWFKKTQKKVVPVEVEGIPEELIRTGNEERQEVAAYSGGYPFSISGDIRSVPS